ncbi:hypothetical protein INR49_022531 [Caranx melampygus]|nr:hypothetical protein INR49_022531 [Caranx melampygus]
MADSSWILSLRMAAEVKLCLKMCCLSASAAASTGTLTLEMKVVNEGRKYQRHGRSRMKRTQKFDLTFRFAAISFNEAKCLIVKKAFFILRPYLGLVGLFMLVEVVSLEDENPELTDSQFFPSFALFHIL